MTYYTLMLNVSNMEGNPFMNFFWQSLVELPGYVVGKYLSDRYGRRWTQAVLFLFLILAVIVVICVVGRKYPHRADVDLGLNAGMKVCCVSHTRQQDMFIRLSHHVLATHLSICPSSH
jgi:sugar phosphate permease